MVKFKWTIDKIRLQRVILFSIIGMISFGIFKGHMEYEKEVAEYMQSMEYRKAKEASQEYHVQQMKRNQQLLASEEPPAPVAITDQTEES